MNQESLFAAALELSATERQAFLDQACGGDARLRQRVEKLLSAHEHPPGLLDSAAEDFVLGAPPSVGSPAEQPIAEGPGDMIGHYKLREQIGEGGFGLVFVAEQQHPVRRKVALKIIKPGMDTREVIARFQAERQALALMDHPNIAKVLDAGTTGPNSPSPFPEREEGEDYSPSPLRGEGRREGSFVGRPYFVMELVRGVAITDYCDQQQLTTRERLELFVSVCHAVQHAHQKGIIHRDLKPSNLLVTLHDGMPVVKVIDFGVAKALNQQLTEQSIYTRFAQMIGTPTYMSPEQAEMSGLDVDTRSDIYSLGVVLYELLTGSTPFDKARLATAGLDEIRRIIREEEPEKPSTRLSHSKDTLGSVAAQRRTEPAKLTRLIRGELDWIVMKALEKDRTRRYATANGFARDVQRYLADEPVEACPPSAAYRLRKLGRKHKRALATAAAFVGLLIAGALVSVWLAVRATLAERRAYGDRALALAAQELAEARFQLARESVDKYLSKVTDEPKLKEKDFTKLRKKLLEIAVPFYQKLAEQRGGDAELETARGNAYKRLAVLRTELGDLEAALADYAQMRAIFERLTGENPADPGHRQMVAAAQNDQGRLLVRIGKHTEAKASYLAALKSHEALAAEFPRVPQHRRLLATSYNNLAALQAQIGASADAESSFRAALAILERLVAESAGNSTYRLDLARSRSNLGALLVGLGKFAEAEAEYRAALVVQEKLVAESPDNPAHRAALADSHNGMGIVLSHVGQPAEGNFRAALALRERLVADFPNVPEYSQELASSHNNLGLRLAAMDKPAEAEIAYRTAAAILQKLTADAPNVPAYAVDLGASHVNMGRLLRESGRADAALAWYGKGIAVLSAVLAQDARLATARRFLRNAHWGRAESLQQLSRHTDALKDWDRVVELNDEKQFETFFSRARDAARAESK